ncbi:MULTISPECIES: hypothetical protein [Cysteiniphilum]|uniref:hypothetical protein n=1 Tax=Cysteiniphilum TaxID=2056696 RepID=UPI00177FBD93|nr:MULTISPECIES: hypothetical protein [Cysteiniphilum]
MENAKLTEEEKKAIDVLGRCGSAILSGFILNTDIEKTSLLISMINEQPIAERRNLAVQLANNFIKDFINDSLEHATDEFKRYLHMIIDDMK